MIQIDHAMAHNHISASIGYRIFVRSTGDYIFAYSHSYNPRETPAKKQFLLTRVPPPLDKRSCLCLHLIFVLFA